MSNLDLGVYVEGTLEADPNTGLPVVRFDGQGVDVVLALEKYRGKRIRLIAVPLDSVEEISRLVEEGGIDLESR